MTKYSILKAVKTPTPVASPSTTNSSKTAIIPRRRPQILPKQFLSKLEISSLTELKKYRKQGLLSSKSSVISTIGVQKAGMFGTFSELMNFLYLQNELDQTTFHSVLFKKLAKKIKNRGCHSSLNITLTSCDDFAFHFLHTFKKAIASAKILSSFNISWKLSEDTNVVCLPIFNNMLKKLRKIKTLSVDFQGTELTHSNLACFTQTISKLKQLQTLKLNTYAALPASDPSFQGNMPITNIACALKSLKKLQELDLDLSRNALASNVSLQEITASIIQMKSLNRLRISLNKTTATSEDELIAFISSFKMLPSLLHLSLGLNSCFKNHRNLEVFCESLNTMTQLESLNLFCDNWNPKNCQDIEKLAYSIGNLVNLSHLVITLNRWTRACSHSFRAICSAVSNLKKLEILVLDFSHWSHQVNCENFSHSQDPFTNRAVANLAEKLSSLQNLKQIALYLNDIEGVTGHGIAYLVKLISNLKYLQSLILTAERYEEFARDDLLNIGKYLLRIENLETSFLSLENTNVSSRDLREFSKITKSLRDKVTVQTSVSGSSKSKTRNPK